MRSRESELSIVQGGYASIENDNGDMKGSNMYRSAITGIFEITRGRIGYVVARST